MNKKLFKIGELEVQAYPIDTRVVIAGQLKSITAVFADNAGEVYYLVGSSNIVFLSAQEVAKLVLHDISKLQIV